MKKILLTALSLSLLLIGCNDKPAQEKPAQAQTPPPAPAVVAAPAAVDGATLFKRCVACHGADGKTPAMGKGAAIAGRSEAATIEALGEYRAGKRNTYGMGNLMKAQAEKLSDDEISALAGRIAKL